MVYKHALNVITVETKSHSFIFLDIYYLLFITNWFLSSYDVLHKLHNSKEMFSWLLHSESVSCLCASVRSDLEEQHRNLWSACDVTSARTRLHLLTPRGDDKHLQMPCWGRIQLHPSSHSIVLSLLCSKFHTIDLNLLWKLCTFFYLSWQVTSILTW